MIKFYHLQAFCLHRTQVAHPVVFPFPSLFSENGRAADYQAGVDPNQKQSGRSAGEPRAHGEGPQQEVR